MVFIIAPLHMLHRDTKECGNVINALSSIT